MGYVLAEAVVAMFVTLGILSLMQWIRRVLLMPKQVTVAVSVLTQTDMDNMDILLSEAATSEARRRGVPLVVLISADLLQDRGGEVGDGGEADRSKGLHPEMEEMMAAYGAVWYEIHPRVE